MPAPSFDALGHEPLLIRSSAVHDVSLLPLSFTPFGRSRTICLTVLLLSGLLVTLNVNLAALGFFVVPAFDGVMETSLATTGAGFCANAMAGKAATASTAAPHRSFRQGGRPPRGAGD